MTGCNWVSAVGQFNDVVPVHANAGLSNTPRGMNNRWRHAAQVTWQNEALMAPLSQHCQSAIRDQHLPWTTGAGSTVPHDVAACSQYNLMVKYTGIKHLGLSLGSSKLLDAQPLLTKHTACRAT